MDNERIDITENDEELLRIYDHSGSRRTDDASAMQAAVCIILAAMYFAGWYAFPELTLALLDRVRCLSESQNELFPNPIRLIEGLF